MGCCRWVLRSFCRPHPAWAGRNLAAALNSTAVIDPEPGWHRQEPGLQPEHARRTGDSAVTSSAAAAACSRDRRGAHHAGNRVSDTSRKATTRQMVQPACQRPMAWMSAGLCPRRATQLGLIACRGRGDSPKITNLVSVPVVAAAATCVAPAPSEIRPLLQPWSRLLAAYRAQRRAVHRRYRRAPGTVRRSDSYAPRGGNSPRPPSRPRKTSSISGGWPGLAS